MRKTQVDTQQECCIVLDTNLMSLTLTLKLAVDYPVIQNKNLGTASQTLLTEVKLHLRHRLPFFTCFEVILLTFSKHHD